MDTNYKLGRRSALNGMVAAIAAILVVVMLLPTGRPGAAAETVHAAALDSGAIKSAVPDGRQDHLRKPVARHADATSADSVRVVVRSYQTAAISAEINARITHLPPREGDRFRKGDLLIAFDCAKIHAEHKAATAVVNAQRAAFETQQKLLQYKAAGSLAVDQARYELQKAEADVQGLDARRTGCTIYAPFDGRVAEKLAQVHEIAQPNQPLIKIIDESKLELVLMVPSGWLAAVTDGTVFSVKIDENRETHAARIVQSTGLIDPVSQSARLIAEIVGEAPSVLPGMSGTAIFADERLVK